MSTYKEVNSSDDYAYVAAQAEAEGFRRGWSEALDAARKAIEIQKYIPVQDRKIFIITRDAELWKQRDLWTEFGWWGFRDSALIAIEDLRYEP